VTILAERISAVYGTVGPMQLVRLSLHASMIHGTADAHLHAAYAEAD
jgi:hypothetical protein